MNDEIAEYIHKELQLKKTTLNDSFPQKLSFYNHVIFIYINYIYIFITIFYNIVLIYQPPCSLNIGICY